MSNQDENLEGRLRKLAEQLNQPTPEKQQEPEEPKEKKKKSKLFDTSDALSMLRATNPTKFGSHGDDGSDGDEIGDSTLKRYVPNLEWNTHLNRFVPKTKPSFTIPIFKPREDDDNDYQDSSAQMPPPKTGSGFNTNIFTPTPPIKKSHSGYKRAHTKNPKAVAAKKSGNSESISKDLTVPHKKEQAYLTGIIKRHYGKIIAGALGITGIILGAHYQKSDIIDYSKTLATGGFYSSLVNFGSVVLLSLEQRIKVASPGVLLESAIVAFGAGMLSTGIAIATYVPKGNYAPAPEHYGQIVGAFIGGLGTVLIYKVVNSIRGN